MKNMSGIVAIVEDNELFRDALVEKLQGKHELRVFTCVEEAEVGIDETVDLVVLDLCLPLRAGQAPPQR